MDLLMGIKGLDFESAWKNRQTVEIENVAVQLISRDDLISAKLEAGRPQDLIDAKNLRQSRKKTD